jgi:hypothetical protein
MSKKYCVETNDFDELPLMSDELSLHIKYFALNI